MKPSRELDLARDRASLIAAERGAEPPPAIADAILARVEQTIRGERRAVVQKEERTTGAQ